MDEKLLSAIQLAEQLQIPVDTVHVWRYRSLGPRWLKVGKHVRYRESDVHSWLKSRERG